MKTSFKLSTIIPVSARTVYNAWLSSEGHSAMTGAKAEAHKKVGAEFSAWDGYIEGVTIELIPNQLIVQLWRTSEFTEEDQSSRLEIALTDVKEGCLLELNHSNIPASHTGYESGWQKHYFEPMIAYFNGMKI